MKRKPVATSQEVARCLKRHAIRSIGGGTIDSALVRRFEQALEESTADFQRDAEQLDQQLDRISREQELDGSTPSPKTEGLLEELKRSNEDWGDDESIEKGARREGNNEERQEQRHVTPAKNGEYNMPRDSEGEEESMGEIWEG